MYRADVLRTTEHLVLFKKTRNEEIRLGMSASPRHRSLVLSADYARLTAMEWYENPIVAALTGAFFAALVAIYLARRTRKIRRVDCIVTDVASLLTFSELIKEKLQVTFDKTPVQSVYLMSLEVVNTGTEAVTSQPVNIRLAEGARIVDYSCQTEPPVGFGDVKEIKLGGHELDLQIELLNPGDKLSLELVSLDNPNESLDVYLKNASVETRIYSRTSAVRTAFDLMNDSHVMWLAILSALPLFGAIARSLIDVSVAQRIGKLRERR